MHWCVPCQTIRSQLSAHNLVCLHPWTCTEISAQDSPVEVFLGRSSRLDVMSLSTGDQVLSKQLLEKIP